ncbi:MAG: hypothetical protein ABIJ56_08945 [Pseudomonadota bacterium]
MIMHIAFVPLVVTVLIDKEREIEYTPIFFKALDRDLAVRDIKEDPGEPEYDPPEKPPEGQVVDAPLPPDVNDKHEVDEKDVKFVSDKTVRTKTESKSPAVMAGAYDIGSVPAGPEELQDQLDTPGAVMPEMIAGELLKESEKGKKPLGTDLLTMEESPPGSAIQLLPTLKAVAEAVKGSGLDKLDDVEEGEKTLLNTTEWKHAGFFIRVKNAVAQYWHPGSAFLMYDPTGRVYGYKDRETVVKVVLDCKGTIKHLYVANPSGAKFLDDEALGALKSAAPFNNPPQPLCDPEDKIIVFNFGFFVKVGDKPIIRVKKYKY